MFRQLAKLTGALLMVAQAGVAIAQDGPVMVTVDRAKVFRIEDGASAVIVGNPFIADVAIFDSNTVVITGKSYGTTNLVILDEKNNPIVDEIITVKAGDESTVSVFRNASRMTMSCNPTCEPTLRMGDAPEVFDGAALQATSRNDLAIKAAGGEQN